MGIHRLTPEEAEKLGFYSKESIEKTKNFSKQELEEELERLHEEGKKQLEEEAKEDIEAHARDLGRRMLASGWIDNKPHGRRKR